MFILMYHRISKPDTNPWGVCVSPEHFEEQIKWLCAHFSVLTPDALWQSLQKDKVPDNSVLITFDDGYQDNFTNARPVLEKYHCPATFFIPTAAIDKAQSFWWDELEWILLQRPTLPGDLQIVVRSALSVVKISPRPLTKKHYRQHSVWRWHEDPPTDRCAGFLYLWQLLRPLPQKEIDEKMKLIRQYAGGSAANPGFRLPMRKAQLLKMTRNPLFSFGLHTHTHADLSHLTGETQLAEITKSDLIFKEQYGISASYCAYPYGMYNPATIDSMRQLKMRLGFTTQQEAVTPATHRFTLGRIQAEDCRLLQFKKLLADLKQ